MAFEYPGCFGHAVTFNLNSKSCQQCHASEECSKSAEQRLMELQSIINVDAMFKMAHNRKPLKAAPAQVEARFDADLSEAAQKIVARLPENAQRTAAALIRTKINFRKALLTGVNPIKNQKPLSVSVLFDLLLSGSASRDDYTLTLHNKLGHSPATSLSQASIGFAIVTGLGIAELQGDRLVIRKDKK